MFLAYLDESSSGDLKKFERRYEIVCGVLVEDSYFEGLETILAYITEFQVPPEFQKDFEFHTSDLWNQAGRFRGMDRAKAVEIVNSCAHMLLNLEIPIFYGAVDMDKHRETLWGDAEPVTIGLRIVLDGVEKWFADRKRDDDLGLVIFDNVTNTELRKAIITSFRHCRKPVRETSGNRGKWQHLHDDLYFGDSAFSAGLQTADLCAYLINRHLQGRPDTEGLYKLIEPQIVCSKVVPEGS